MSDQTALDRAARALEAELADRAPGDPTLTELAKSQRLLARTTLLKARRGTDPDEDREEDDIDAESENDEDARDQDEVEDDDPDNADPDSGVDDARGVAKARTAKARAAVKTAQARLKKAEEDEESALDDDDDERLERARRRRESAEDSLDRARSRLRRAKPAWAGDDATTAKTAKERRDAFEDVYADGNGAYYTNEDADHEETEIVPPDGPEVADGNDRDVYTIGAHKVRAERAVRRSYAAQPPTGEALAKSLAADGRLTEDLLDASPALEAIADVVVAQQSVLAKSQAVQTAHARLLRAHLQNGALQNRALSDQSQRVGSLEKSMRRLEKKLDAVLQQPVVSPMGGMPPGLSVVRASAGATAPTKLAKSRADLLVDAEEALGRGDLDPKLFAQISRLTDAESIRAAVPAATRKALNW